MWTRLLEHWNSSTYRSKCIAAKKNRASETAGALHTGGSITTHEHTLRMVYTLTSVSWWSLSADTYLEVY